jgi:glycosyltransferase involved in cell wall biosynthesis
MSCRRRAQGRPIKNNKDRTEWSMESHGLSIVIPCRNERLLGFTVSRLHDTVRVPYEVIVVDDGSDQRQHFEGIDAQLMRNNRPIGVDFARDVGIAAARYEAILTIDGHMNFPDDDWSRRIVDHVHSHPADIGCAACPRLSEDQLELDAVAEVHYGAQLHHREPAVQIAVQENGVERKAALQTILPAHWSDDNRDRAALQPDEAVEIGCILGAAYTLSRSRYMGELRRPWRHLRGWGSGEQHVSLPNYLLGGRSVLLPISIGHVFRADLASVPYRTDVAYILYNNVRLAHLVMPEAECADEVGWVLSHWRGTRVESVVNQQLASSNWRQYRNHLAAGPRSWEDYQQQWMDDRTAA